MSIIPSFCNTDHALDFARLLRGDQFVIDQLRQERQRLVKQAKILEAQGETNKALYLASGQAQFVRECLEEIVK